MLICEEDFDCMHTLLLDVKIIYKHCMPIMSNANQLLPDLVCGEFKLLGSCHIRAVFFVNEFCIQLRMKVNIYFLQKNISKKCKKIMQL